MKFMRSTIDLLIVVMLGLVTVILTYNVQQCDQTVQTITNYNFNTEWNGKTTFSDRYSDPEFLKWFKWGRLFSFCRYLNSTYDYGCKTWDCKECLTVCRMDSEIRNVTSLCEQNCTSNACKEGCRFYSEVFNESIGNSVTHDTEIRKPKINDGKVGEPMINIISSTNGIDLSWSSVFSDDAFEIPSLYLVINDRVNSGEMQILALTESSRYFAEIKDLCRNTVLSFLNLVYNVFFFVIPINFVGPKKIEIGNYYSSSIVRFAERSVNFSISKPFFEKSVEGNFDHVVWKIEWEGLLHINEDVRIRYYIKNCPFVTNLKEMNKLNPWNMLIVKDGLFRMANTKDDKLSLCEISLELRIMWGECIIGNPYNTIIKYGGCETIPGYPYPCKDTLIYEFSATSSAGDCSNPFIDACPQNKNITCQYCETTRHSIKVTWEHPTYAMMVKEYTMRWGELINGVLENSKTAKLPKSYTSYTIDFFSSELKLIGLQVHAETSMSKPLWKWKDNKNSIQNITLKPVEPKPLSSALEPTKDKIISPITIVIIVVVFLAVSCSITLYIIHRRRSNLIENYKRNEIEMEDKQESGAVDRWEISSAILTLDEKIGEGAFGNVYCAFVKTNELRKTPYAKQCSGIKLMGTMTKVAVKFLKDDAQEMEYKDFNDEIKLMKDIGFHQNIVNMIGCSTITRLPCLVLEYMNGGDLLHYMRVFRKNKGCTGVSVSKAAVAGTEDDSTENVGHLSPRDFMSFSWQIACGMEYLSMSNVVHRDLAARNILISDDKKIKISDFGLSRYVSDELIYLSNNMSRKLPIKWMSIESIYHQEFTTASDVWAYGVVLFEIVTLGGTPYPSIGNRELCKLLKSGYRMDKPDNCKDTVYHIMLHCWNAIPTERPTFTELREHLEELVENDEIYCSFDIDENVSYYNIASFKSISSDANDDGDDVIRNEFIEKQ